MNAFYGKSYNELEGMRLDGEKALNGVLAAESMAGSAHGAQWIKRLEADLLAIRCKYFGVRGNNDERLCELARLQGREEQVKSELDVLLNANKYHKAIMADTERLTAAMTELKKNEGGR